MTTKNIIISITLTIVASLLYNHAANSQSLTPQIISTAGGYFTNTAGSLSFTVGETSTQTLTSANHMLTQGFQQPFELNLINLKAFLEGYYVGGGMMNDALYNQGEYTNPSTIADSITVELHEATTPYNVVFFRKLTINQNGTTTIKGMGTIGQSYYLVIKHRNSVEIWSANPIAISAITNYDFSTNASKAFGSNQKEVETGVWALYSGDINQDLAVDAFDYVLLDSDLIVGASGYLNTDLTGDGSVDAFDYLLMDVNLVSGVGASTP